MTVLDYGAKAYGSWRTLPNKTQLLVVAACRFPEAMSSTVLLPHTYNLVESALSYGGQDSDSSTVAHWAGLLTAMFPLGQALSNVAWGAAADRWGRKATLVSGLYLSAICSVAFGFSQSIAALLVWRLACGMAMGNTAVLRTMLVEIAGDRQHRPRALALPPIFIKLGIVAGSLVGGHLYSQLEDDKATLRARWKVLRSWDHSIAHAPPAFVISAVCLICLALVASYIKETNPATNVSLITRHGPSKGEYARVAITEVAAEEQGLMEVEKGEQRPTKPQSLLRVVCQSLLHFCLFALHNSGFGYALPIMLATPANEDASASLHHKLGGGTDLESDEIGTWLAAAAIFGITVQSLVVPRMAARFSLLQCLIIANVVFAIAYLAGPCITGLVESLHIQRVILAGVLGIQVLGRNIAFPVCILLLSDAAPAGRRGTVHGLGSMITSIAKAVGSIGAGLMMTWSMQSHVPAAVWWLYLLPLSLIALVFAIFTSRSI